jgi:hypothetical protein
MAGTKASWWQTVLLAVISSALPFVLAVSTGGTISYRTAIAAVIAAGMTAGANLLRSPVNNPTSIFPDKPSDPVPSPPAPPPNQGGN